MDEDHPLSRGSIARGGRWLCAAAVGRGGLGYGRQFTGHKKREDTHATPPLSFFLIGLIAMILISFIAHVKPSSPPSSPIELGSCLNRIHKCEAHLRSARSADSPLQRACGRA